VRATPEGSHPALAALVTAARHGYAGD